MTTAYWTGLTNDVYSEGAAPGSTFTSESSDSLGATFSLEGDDASLNVGSQVALRAGGDLIGTYTDRGFVAFGGLNYPVITGAGPSLVPDIALPNGSYGITPGVVCYLRGARILTAAGERPVEGLRPDELVAAFGGEACTLEIAGHAMPRYLLAEAEADRAGTALARAA